MEKDAWGDLWWLSLYVLSKATWVLFLLASVGMSVYMGGLCFIATENKLFGVAAAAWTWIISLIGSEWVRFKWNQILEKEGAKLKK